MTPRRLRGNHPAMTDQSMADALTAERCTAERVMGKGTVKWLSKEDGYGLISADEGDEDLVFWPTSIAEGGFETVGEGTRVEFEVHEGRRGLEAFGVVPL